MFAKLIFAATAGAILLTSPVSVTIADAAKIKVQVKTVTIKPKVTVMKPKVRIKKKVKVTTVKPRIKVKQKIAVAKPKVAKPPKAVIAKPKIASKVVTVKQVAKIKPAPAAKLKAKVALKVKSAAKVAARKKPVRLAKQTTKSPVPAPKLATVKLETPKRKLASIPESALPVPAKRPALKTVDVKPATTPIAEKSVPRGASSEAAAAAKAAAEIAALAVQGTGRAGSSAPLFKDVPGLSSAAPKGNQDILQGMQRERKGPAAGAFTPGSDWTNNAPGGFGPDQFAGLPNTHRQAPANAGNAGQAAQDFWSGQMSGSISGARDGVAAQGGGTTIVRRVDHGTERTEHMPGLLTHTYTVYYGNGHRQEHTDVTYPNGTHSYGYTRYDSYGNPVRREYIPSPTSGERSQVEHFETPRVVEIESGKPPKPPQDDGKPGKPGVNPTKLYAPDFTEGGPTPFPWIEEGGAFDFRNAGGKTPGAMPQGPDDARPKAVPTASVMTTNDLLERYDPDNQHRGDERFRFENACFHSEC